MRSLPLIVIATLAAALSMDGLAQAYPNRPTRLIVPFPPGGTPDANARTLTGPIERSLGQNIVVDNRSGANGIIGMESVAHAAPDGYTFLYTTVAFIINPAVYKRPPFDVVRDFTPVTNVAIDLDYVIVVARFQSEVRRAIETPQAWEFLVASGFEPIGDSPDEFRKFVAAELKKRAKLARIARLKPG